MEKLELRVNGIVIAVTQISTPVHLVAQFHIFSTLITSTTDYVNLQVPQPPMFSPSHYLNLTLPQPDVHSTSNSLNLTAVSNFTFNISLPQPHAHSFTLPTSYSVLSSTSPRIGLLAGRRPALAEGGLPSPPISGSLLACIALIEKKLARDVILLCFPNGGPLFLRAKPTPPTNAHEWLSNGCARSTAADTSLHVLVGCPRSATVA